MAGLEHPYLTIKAPVLIFFAMAWRKKERGALYQ